MRKINKSVEVLDESDGKRQLSFVITTDEVDRDNDIIKADGWRLDNYLKNPVVLFGHNWGGLPVGKCISITKMEHALKATVEFVSKEISPFAETVYQMCKQGFLKATSVGFSVIKSAYDNERHGFDIMEAELLEFSIVPIPANASALIEASGKGIDISVFEKHLEDEINSNKGMLEAYFTMKKAQIETEKENPVETDKIAEDEINNLKEQVKNLEEERNSLQEKLDNIEKEKSILSLKQSILKEFKEGK